MFVSLRYNGTYKRRINWNSMGECFSYVVRPGEVIDVPATQVLNAKGAAPFTEVKRNKKKGVKVIRKIFEKESSEVVTKKDRNLFKKQDKLDPFAGYEKDGKSVEIEIEDEEPEKELPEEEEVAVEEVVKEEIVVEEEKVVEKEEEEVVEEPVVPKLKNWPKIENEAVEEEIVEKEVVEDVVNDEVEDVVQGDSWVVENDFAPWNKKELATWLIEHGNAEKEYKLMKEKKDTLIAMCVDLEASL